MKPNVNCRLPQDLIERLEKEAKKELRNRSNMIEKILREHFETLDQKKH